MNIKEAEKYFKQYNGHGFHMCREEPTKYDEYRLLNISPKMEESWRQDIIDKLFKDFFECRESVWNKHSMIVSVLLATKTRIAENSCRLLSVMEQMDTLDVKQKILIIENMAGRTKSQKDGGCYLICSHTNQAFKMNIVMEHLMNFECGIEDNLEEHGWKNVRERYLRAVSSYKSAYYRFGDAKVNKENTDIITGMKVKLLDCDYAPADLPEQLPIICEVIRKIPGEDRPDYYLVRCEKEIKYNKYTIRYLVIAPRFMGQELRENVDEIALGVAYVGNISLLEDNVLDFNKCTYVAVCIGTTKDLY